MVRPSTLRRQQHLEEITASILAARFAPTEVSATDDLFVIKSGARAVCLSVQPTRRRLPPETLKRHKRLRQEGFDVRTVHSVVELEMALADVRRSA